MNAIIVEAVGPLTIKVPGESFTIRVSGPLTWVGMPTTFQLWLDFVQNNILVAYSQELMVNLGNPDLVTPTTSNIDFTITTAPFLRSPVDGPLDVILVIGLGSYNRMDYPISPDSVFYEAVIHGAYSIVTPQNQFTQFPTVIV